MAISLVDALESDESERRNSGIIGYGSLLHPDEAAEEFEDPLVAPFGLEGYKRIFNNRSAWRNPEGKQSAVLNVASDSNSWCNVVLILIHDEARPDDYEEREQGYDFYDVSTDQLRPYISSHGQLLATINKIEIPIGNRIESDIQPIPSYVEKCLEGAEYWDEELQDFADTDLGTEFLEHFIQTTELADGTPLSEYLNNRSIRTKY